jgi:hypothetical protein
LEIEPEPLWDDDAIDRDTRHVLRSRVADRARETYNNYTIRSFLMQIV